MKFFDFKCPECGTTRMDEPFMSTIAANSAYLYCKVCQQDCDRDVRLIRILPAPGFSIKGYNAKNGYSKEK